MYITYSSLLLVGWFSASLSYCVNSTWAVTTLAGSGTAGWANGVATAAAFSGPYGIALDEARGVAYVSQKQTLCSVRNVSLASGNVSVIAGNGSCGIDFDGVGTLAAFAAPGSLSLDTAGGLLYMGTTQFCRIRRISLATRASITLAGSVTCGAADGVGTSAQFLLPRAVSVDVTNRLLYITDSGNNNIRVMNLTSLVVRTLSPLNSTAAGYVDGAAAVARFNSPMNGRVDPVANVLWIADQGNNLVRKIVLTAPGVVGAVSSVSGVPGYSSQTCKGLQPSYAQNQSIVWVNSYNNAVGGAVYRIDIGNRNVISIAAGVINGATTVNGVGTNAQFRGLVDLAVSADGNRTYLCDYTGNQIRVLTLVCPSAPSASASSTPSGTATGSSTASLSASPAATPSQTATGTATLTLGASASGTASQSGTPTNTDSMSSTATASPPGSGSSSLSASPPATSSSMPSQSSAPTTSSSCSGTTPPGGAGAPTPSPSSSQGAPSTSPSASLSFGSSPSSTPSQGSGGGAAGALAVDGSGSGGSAAAIGGAAAGIVVVAAGVAAGMMLRRRRRSAAAAALTSPAGPKSASAAAGRVSGGVMSPLAAPRAAVAGSFRAPPQAPAAGSKDVPTFSTRNAASAAAPAAPAAAPTLGFAQASEGLPPGWEPIFSRSKNTYYYRHKASQETSWVKPTAAAATAAASSLASTASSGSAASAAAPAGSPSSDAASGLPPGWTAVWSKSKSAFYWRNAATGETSWEKPRA